MKLNYRRTILVGFAFFLISAFWQAYDATIPVILTNKFGMNQTWSGVIMALDNVLAVFMLPIFGALSDRCRSKKGKRTPFITFGTIIAAIALVCLSFVDYAQLNKISDVSAIDDPKAMAVIYDQQKDANLQTPEGDEFVLSDKFDKDYFVSIKCQLEVVKTDDVMEILDDFNIKPGAEEGKTFVLSQRLSREAFDAYLSEGGNEKSAALLTLVYEHNMPVTVYEEEGYIMTAQLSDGAINALATHLEMPADEIGKTITHPYYIDYVAPARQACAADATAQQPILLILFIVLLLAVLIAMATFRSPAVALMPDVTIKPLRSKGNAIINLMGTAGGILVLVLGIVFATSAVTNSMMTYIPYYLVIAGLMLAALGIFRLTVKEPQWAANMRSTSRALGIEESEETEENEHRKLGKSERKSLLLILASVALWYIGYNAVTSKYSLYASEILSMDYNATMLIAQGAAIVAYLPAGLVASKIGRKKTILAGVIMLSSAFLLASFMRAGSSVLLMNILFATAGIGWATINVNSFPMVVELCAGGDTGKYTGYYYTASMAAQIVTPIFSGFLMDLPGLGKTVLFPYATIFVGLAFLTMFFVKHGDAKPESKKGLEALDIDD